MTLRKASLTLRSAEETLRSRALERRWREKCGENSGKGSVRERWPGADLVERR